MDEDTSGTGSLVELAIANDCPASQPVLETITKPMYDVRVSSNHVPLTGRPSRPPLHVALYRALHLLSIKCFSASMLLVPMIIRFIRFSIHSIHPFLLVTCINCTAAVLTAVPSPPPESRDMKNEQPWSVCLLHRCTFRVIARAPPPILGRSAAASPKVHRRRRHSTPP